MNKDFISELKEISSIVDKWPEWKKKGWWYMDEITATIEAEEVIKDETSTTAVLEAEEVIRDGTSITAILRAK